MKFSFYSSLLILCFLAEGCKRTDPDRTTVLKLQLGSVRIGVLDLNTSDFTKNVSVPVDQPIVVSFSSSLDLTSVSGSSFILTQGSNTIDVDFAFLDNNKTISARPKQNLTANQKYSLSLSSNLKGSQGEQFQGITLEFSTANPPLGIVSLKFGSQTFLSTDVISDIPFNNLIIEVNFSSPLDANQVNTQNIQILGPGNPTISLTLQDLNKKLVIHANQSLQHITKHRLYLSDQMKGADGEVFVLYVRNFYTAIDPTPKFPVVSDDALLTLVQQQTFKYFWDFGHPSCGLARERNTSGDLVTTGGSGFGLMAIIVGIDRGFITRIEGIDRLNKIVSFLETADRFHGAWPHWMNGITGKVFPFSTKDDGGDLVETSFLMQGLLTFRQYLNPGVISENDLINRINVLWQSVEWDWYRQNGQNVLYWHWSPNYYWDLNFALSGYFEEQITYFLAAASPTHSIPKIVYSNGFGKNGAIVKNNTYYGYLLPLESPAPLFWVQYSYLGLNPHFSDDYANYWTQNVNASLINHAYCVANPRHYIGYSDQCWGLTASDNQSGYSAHSPGNDLGVITPTAALSSMPYTPVESLKAIKYFYYTIGDKTWGPYGFYDAFNTTEGWYANTYLAIDEGPIIVMIENYRTGLLWNLFMSSPEVTTAKFKLNFN